ncbi:hypothetical protein FNF31_06741 [Cafeteria roenbergensis]|uniref:Alpha-galactosidase n=1 Tax=Cafeteria roenbergensis TaxID=33653 RepID=A0A5A8CI36_CAFRO|nr:hypothetical protein FNF31_06741 [Cafeteria roenbergensis]KAA0153237.1 hypothetical protein FNF28_06971 [Cafeteria roenbergensis]
MKSGAALVLALAAGATAYNNGLGTVPPLGWSSWCVQDVTCGLVDTCTESEIHSVVDAMVLQQMPGLGYKYVFLDDCWASTERDANGNIQPDASQFPSGIPSLREYVDKAEMELGLYTCAGPTTCRWNRTGSGGHYVADALTFAMWQIDFVKADNCHHPHEPPPVYYGNLSHALNISGRAMSFNLCEWGEDAVWTWGTSIAQSFRVGPDHLPVWSFPALQQERRLWQSQLEGLPVSALQAAHPSLSARDLAAEEAKRAERLAWDARMRAAGRKGGLSASLASLERRYAAGLGQGTSDIIEHMAVVANSTSAYGKADPDFAETMLWFLTPFTDSQTEWSFWCLWGGNLLMATDTRWMSAEKSSIVLNAEAINVHQDPTAPPGSRRSIAANKVQLWARDMSNSDVTVILFNPTETNQTAAMQWSDVGISGTPAAVRDLWQHANLQPNMAGFARELEPHQVAMLRLSR